MEPGLFGRSQKSSKKRPSLSARPKRSDNRRTDTYGTKGGQKEPGTQGRSALPEKHALGSGRNSATNTGIGARHNMRKKLRNYRCTSVRTTCVGSFASIASFANICSFGKDRESYRSKHPLTVARKASKASKAMDAPPILATQSPTLPTQPPTLPTQPPTLPMQPPPYGS